MLKSLLIVLTILLGIVLVSTGLWLSHARPQKNLSHTNTDNHPASKLTPPNNFKPLSTNFVAGSEWQEYHSAQKKALLDNPDLAAEYKSIMTALAAQQKEEEAAMLKADPNMAPILAKLGQIRQNNTVPAAFPQTR